MQKTFSIQCLFLTLLLLTIAAQYQCKNLTSKAEDLVKNEEILKTFEENTSKNFHKEKKHQDFWHQENILQLTGDNLLSFERRDEIWIVLFYQPEDNTKGGEDIFKVWRELADKLDGVMKVGAVNCSEATTLCERFTVSNTPKILLFEANVTARPISFHGYVYYVDAFVTFASRYMPDFVKHINSYEDFSLENFDEAKVIYVSRVPETPPLFKALSKEFKGKISFARVNQVQTRFVRKFGLTVFPTFLFLNDPFSFKAVQYQGPFNYVGTKNFLKSQYPSFVLSGFYRRKEVWLTLFYQSTDLSRTSRNYQQAWKQVSEKLNGIVRVSEFDCDQESEKLLCQEFFVNEAPKILLFPGDSGAEALTFAGSIESDQIVSFALTQIKSLVKNITDNNYDSFIQENSKIDKVLLFTQENATSPLFNALSNEFKERMVFGEVKESNTALIDQFKVITFPTIYFLGPEENFNKTKYEGKFNRDELARSIRFVSQASIINDFQRRNEIWLVFFYKSGDFISQNEKNIWNIWKNISNELSGRIKVVAIDCLKGVDEFACTDFTQDFPTIKIFPSTAEVQSVTYNGLIESDLIVSFAINQIESFEKSTGSN